MILGLVGFDSLPLWGNGLILAVAGALVWRSGVRLEGAVQVISTQTRLGSAFGGIFLLALSTSLPEVSTTITGGLLGDAALVTNNLLGGVMLQTALLVMADWVLKRGALTYFAPQFTLLLGGVSLILLLALALAVMAVGDSVTLFAVGLGSVLIFTIHLAQLYLMYRSGKHKRWQPVLEENSPVHPKSKDDEKDSDASLTRSWVIFGVASGVIFVCGWAVMKSAHALTQQTAVSSSFVGATLVALATSLPEVSTTLTAVKRGHNDLAISNIFGSNLWCVALLLVGDVFYRSGPLLADAPRQALFTCSVGVVMTSIYLWGLLERRNRTIGRLGWDSVLALLTYLVAMVLLYRMK